MLIHFRSASITLAIFLLCFSGLAISASPLSQNSLTNQTQQDTGTSEPPPK